MGNRIYVLKLGSGADTSRLFVLCAAEKEEKQRGISVATDGAQTHFILLLKPKNAGASLCFELFRLCFHWKQMSVFCLGKSQGVIFSRNQQQRMF